MVNGEREGGCAEFSKKPEASGRGRAGAGSNCGENPIGFRFIWARHEEQRIVLTSRKREVYSAGGRQKGRSLRTTPTDNEERGRIRFESINVTGKRVGVTLISQKKRKGIIMASPATSKKDRDQGARTRN